MGALRLAVLPFVLLLASLAAKAQPLELQVELLNNVGTDVSRKGDLISARVISPAHLKGDLVDGKITDSRAGSTSVLSFSFDTLHHGTSNIAISSQFKSATNSKGNANVDEEGRMVRRSSSTAPRAGGAASTGALLGRIAGGNRGAAIGSAAGSTASILLVQIASDGPGIRFSQGSRFLIEAQARSGPALATLAPNQQPAQAGAPVTAAVAAPVPALRTEPAPAAAPAAQAQPPMTALKSAFIPGEKTIFYDDFTDMGPGDAPPHFKIRGPAPELREGGGIRQLCAIHRGTMFPNLTALPKNFTYEADIKLDDPKRSITQLIFSSKTKQIFILALYAESKVTDLVASMRAPYQELGRKRTPVNWTEPATLALWVQNGRLRVFLNGEKHLDFNQVEMPPIDQVEMTHEIAGANQFFGYRRVRFAESTPDFSQTIAASGRYVTYGILFDTDNDRLKPESAPVIQGIAQGLIANPGLKLLIEGHTDATGNAAHNLDLSKRRAEAVKTVLCQQFQIDASRLSSDGLGSTKPLAANDTPMGRSQNRRVELVKQ